ncbi:MAG: hypothetical protein ACRC5R_05795 [Mycoplasmatales bacterium]
MNVIDKNEIDIDVINHVLVIKDLQKILKQKLTNPKKDTYLIYLYLIYKKVDFSNFFIYSYQSSRNIYDKNLDNLCAANIITKKEDSYIVNEKYLNKKS